MRLPQLRLSSTFCRRVVSVRDYLSEKKSSKVFSSSPLEDNGSVTFPNDVSAIKGPNPSHKTMTGRKKVSVMESTKVCKMVRTGRDH